VDDLTKKMMIDGELSGGARRQPTKYNPPKEGDKMRALYAINLLPISGGAKAVAAALIWHANARPADATQASTDLLPKPNWSVGQSTQDRRASRPLRPHILGCA
jgi:hypothetical protein